ncbi:MAG: SCO family protein [Pseudomonadota bacterium]
MGKSAPFVIAGVVAVLAAGGTLALSWQSDTSGPAAVSQSAPGGPFQLTTHEGGVLSDRDLKGQPFALFFGFTHCPEICPTTMWEMASALDALGDDGDDLKVLFVTVDPERDTQEFLGQYLSAFDPRIIGLTGPLADVGALGRHYNAYWDKVPLKNGGYTMNHTANVYLMDGSGQYFDVIGFGEDPKSRVKKLRALLATAPKPHDGNAADHRASTFAQSR